LRAKPRANATDVGDLDPALDREVQVESEERRPNEATPDARPLGQPESEEGDQSEEGAEQNGEKGRPEAIIEEIVGEVAWRLRLEVANAIEPLRAERRRLEETLGSLQELVSEASEFTQRGSVTDEHQELPKGAKTDLNRAGNSELRALGMSETQAARVIRHRDFWGEFRSVEELDQVAGFVPRQREELKQHLVVSLDSDSDD
jgi:DNA uptake protein ComE-like DNA-binding protein